MEYLMLIVAVVGMVILVIAIVNAFLGGSPEEQKAVNLDKSSCGIGTGLYSAELLDYKKPYEGSAGSAPGSLEFHGRRFERCADPVFVNDGSFVCGVGSKLGGGKYDLNFSAGNMAFFLEADNGEYFKYVEDTSECAEEPAQPTGGTCEVITVTSTTEDSISETACGGGSENAIILENQIEFMFTIDGEATGAQLCVDAYSSDADVTIGRMTKTFEFGQYYTPTEICNDFTFDATSSIQVSIDPTYPLTICGLNSDDDHKPRLENIQCA